MRLFCSLYKHILIVPCILSGGKQACFVSKQPFKRKQETKLIVTSIYATSNLEMFIFKTNFQYAIPPQKIFFVVLLDSTLQHS